MIEAFLPRDTDSDVSVIETEICTPLLLFEFKIESKIIARVLLEAVKSSLDVVRLNELLFERRVNALVLGATELELELFTDPVFISIESVMDPELRFVLNNPMLLCTVFVTVEDLETAPNDALLVRNKLLIEVFDGTFVMLLDTDTILLVTDSILSLICVVCAGIVSE